MTEDLVARPLRLDDVPVLLALFHRYDRVLLRRAADGCRRPALGPRCARRRPGNRQPRAAHTRRHPGRCRVRHPAGTRRGPVRRGLGHAGAAQPAGRLRREPRAAARARRGVPVPRRHRHRGRGLARPTRLPAHYTAWIMRLDPTTPIAGRELPAGYAIRPFARGGRRGHLHRGPGRVRGVGEQPAAFVRRLAGRDILDRPHVDPSAFRRGHLPRRGRRCRRRVRLRRRGLGRAARGGQAASGPGSGAAAAGRGLRRRPGSRHPARGTETDTRTGALDLYLRLGMRVLFTLDNYELDIGGR